MTKPPQDQGETANDPAKKLGGGLRSKDPEVRHAAAKRMGELGGAARREALTPERRTELARNAGLANREKNGLAHFQAIGRKGGKARLKHVLTNDPEFYSRQGKIGGEVMRQKCAAKKAAESEGQQ